MKNIKAVDIVGEELAAVLPDDGIPWYRKPYLLRLNLLICIPLLSSSVSGFDGSLMNGLQTLPLWKDYFGDPAGSRLGLVSATQNIGCVVALPFIGTICDRIGRKRTLIIGIIGIILAAIVQVTSHSFAQQAVARVLIGAAGMFMVQPSPALISEIAYPTHRGKLTSLFWDAYYLGAILCSWTVYGTNRLNSSWSWRAPTLLQAGFPLVQLVFVALVPESPRWLITKGRTEEARQFFVKYHTGGHDNALVETQMRLIHEAVEAERQMKRGSWSDLIKTKSMRWRTFIVVTLGVGAQYNGVAVVSYFLTLVLDSVGVTNSRDQTLINGLLQVFNFFAAISGALAVDRLGRRTLFLISTAGMLVSFIIWTVCSERQETTGDKGAGIAVVVLIFVFYFFYDIAYTPLLFGYSTEISPLSMRSKLLSTELFAIYGSLIIASFTNPIGIDNIGWKFYILFDCCLVVLLIAIYFGFPETKGLELEMIAKIFDGEDTLSRLDEQKPASTRSNVVGTGPQLAKIDSEVSHVEHAADRPAKAV